MNAHEVSFIQSVKEIGVEKARNILELLAAYDGPITALRVSAAEKRKAGREFNALFEGSFVPIRRKPSAKEERELDREMRKTHEMGDDHTPLLNSSGMMRPNFSQEIVRYYTLNPGHTVAQGAAALARQFDQVYGSVDEGFTKIKSIINTMSHGKSNQRKLDKRGGRAGRGNPGHVFVR